MIEYFVTFFFVCFGKTDQKEKTFAIMMCVHRVLWIIPFDDSWRHISIHTDSSKYLGSKRVFRYPMIKYDDKRFISQLMNMNWKLFETELKIFSSKNRVIQIRLKRPFIDPCKWLISVLWVFLHLINMDCHEIFPFPFGDSWRRNLIQTDGSEKRETNQGQNVHSLGKCDDKSFHFQFMNMACYELFPVARRLIKIHRLVHPGKEWAKYW